MSGTQLKLYDFYQFLVCVVIALLLPCLGHAQPWRARVAESHFIATMTVPERCCFRWLDGDDCQAEDSGALAGARASVLELDFGPEAWQGWMSALLALAALTGGVILAWRWRMRNLVRQRHVLEEAVLRRTHDLEREKAELLHAREQMRHFAERDGLTGLWNRRIIVDRLRREVDRSHRNGTLLSIILVDLDRFKAVNDTFGHPSGDAVLRWIGKILMRSVRSYDWVGRYGGEEFLIILPGAGLEHARARADELRKGIQSARVPDCDRTIQITASLGVVSGFPDNYESLLRAADAALYRAKHNGRNCVVATEIDLPQQP